MMSVQSVIPMSDQVEMFKEYIEKLKGIVGEGRTKEIVRNSLYVVVAGSDDIANTYFIARVRQLQYDIPSYTELMVNGASDFLKVLINYFHISFNFPSSSSSLAKHVLIN